MKPETPETAGVSRPMPNILMALYRIQSQYLRLNRNCRRIQQGDSCCRIILVQEFWPVSYTVNDLDAALSGSNASIWDGDIHQMEWLRQSRYSDYT